MTPTHATRGSPPVGNVPPLPNLSTKGECPRVAASRPDRMLSVEWAGTSPRKAKVRCKLSADMQRTSRTLPTNERARLASSARSSGG